jgi:hypothetical protein
VEVLLLCLLSLLWPHLLLLPQRSLLGPLLHLLWYRGPVEYICTGLYGIFGFSVAISGDTIVVVSPKDNDKGEDSGSVYVFKKNGGIDSVSVNIYQYQRRGDVWIQIQYTKLVLDDGARGDWFGRSVSISGNTVAVGAPADADDDGEGNVDTGKQLLDWHNQCI